MMDIPWPWKRKKISYCLWQILSSSFQLKTFDRPLTINAVEDNIVESFNLLLIVEIVEDELPNNFDQPLEMEVVEEISLQGMPNLRFEVI